MSQKLYLKVFANIFKWIYRNIHRWIDERRKKNKETSTNVALEYFNEDTEEVLVPTTACILVSVLYVLIGRYYRTYRCIELTGNIKFDLLF